MNFESKIGPGDCPANSSLDDISAQDLAKGTTKTNSVSEEDEPEKSESMLSNHDKISGNEFSSDVNLIKQREIIRDCLELGEKGAKEGDSVCIIPKSWFDEFLNGEQDSTSALGPIDTTSICKDYERFILVDYQIAPYISVPTVVFEKLRKWYGLTPNSRKLDSVLVSDEHTGELKTEYNKPFFRLHFMSSEIDKVHSMAANRYHNEEKSIFFTISRLATLEDLINKALKLFTDREANLRIDDLKYKLWFVSDLPKNTSTFSTDYLDISKISEPWQGRYLIDPKTFMKLSANYRINLTKQRSTFDLRENSVANGDLIVEVKKPGNSSHWPSNYFIYDVSQTDCNTKGLNNLGNTCYMNSALQCLVHIPQVRDYFLYSCHDQEINTRNPLGYQGHIAQAFSALVKSLSREKDYNTERACLNAFSPTNFKYTIGHCNSAFSGYMQQDSQEFLAFLLDGLHEDLNRVLDKPYIEKPVLDKGIDVNKYENLSSLAYKTWEVQLKRNDSMINDLFVGLYKSSLRCPECLTESVTFDPYNVVTLPIPVETVWEKKVKIFPQDSPPCILEVELSRSSSFHDLKNYVANYAGVNASDLYACEVFGHQFYQNFQSLSSTSQYLPISELISESDDIIFYELKFKDGDMIFPVLNTSVDDEYPSPKLFGVPFFITLSLEETKNPFLIRQKLEKAYTNLSGGFIEFPSLLVESNQNIEDLPLLKKVHPCVNFDDYSDLLQDSYGKIADVDNHFAIQFLQQKSYESGSNIEGFNNQNADSDSFSAFWVPDPHYDLSDFKNLQSRMDPLIRDIYNYQTLVRTNEGVESNETYISDVFDDNISLDGKVGLDANGSDNKLEHVEGSSTNSPDSKPTKHERMQQLLFSGDVILCQWKEEARNEAFNPEKGLNWENPALLENKAVEEARKIRDAKKDQKITLYQCFDFFSEPEILDLNDSWYCPVCKKHCQATKQIELWNTPDILLVHLKRFENQRSFSDKIDVTVEFPIQNLNLTDNVADKNDPRGYIYDLLAVDNHYGGLGGGHYTAYAKNHIDGKWYYFDDSRVTETDPERSISGSAYLLFYARRTPDGQLGNNRLKSLISEARNRYETEKNSVIEAQRRLYDENKTDDDESDMISLAVSEYNESSNVLSVSRSSSLGSDDQNDFVMNSNDSANHGSLEGESSDTSLERISTSRDIGCQISSLEVGDENNNPNTHFPEGNADETNSNRRKLRLLDRIYDNSSNLSLGSPTDSENFNSLYSPISDTIDKSNLPASPD